jgi:hypothetical protein
MNFMAQSRELGQQRVQINRFTGWFRRRLRGTCLGGFAQPGPEVGQHCLDGLRR